MLKQLAVVAALTVAPLAIATPAAADEAWAGVRYCRTGNQLRINADVTGNATVMVGGYTVPMGAAGQRQQLVFQAPLRGGYASWFVRADRIHSSSTTCL